MRRTHHAVQLTASQAEIAQTGIKSLIPVGRPFIDYVLASLADAGYQRVCIVIGPHHDALREHVCNYRHGRLDIHFAIQQDALGTANALSVANEFVGGGPFSLINSDNYYPQSALVGLRLAQASAVVAFELEGLRRGNISDERLRHFAVLSSSADGIMRQVVEKPSNVFGSKGKEPLISMNCWRFTPIIFEACRAISRSARGEFELTDAVTYAVDVLGERFQVLVENEPVLDLSTQADIIEVARRLASIRVTL